MKILLINHFPLEGSGSGTYTRNIAVHLTKLGHQVSIIFPENVSTFSSPDGVRKHPVFFTGKENIEGALPFNFPCFTTHPRSSFTFYEMSEAQIMNYLSVFEREIKKEIEAFQPDIIHAQHIWLLSYVVSKLGYPYVVTAHGTDLMGYRKSEEFRKFAYNAAANAGRVIVISEDIEKQVLDLFPQCEGKTLLMKNGYDNTIFYPEEVEKRTLLESFGISQIPESVVIFVGKLAYFKGVDILLKAAKKYNHKLNDDICTLIVGAGELLETLQSTVESRSIQNIHFLGHQSQEVLRKLYSMADVSVVPSRREPFGLVAIEALACGTPVVATAEGGLAEIIKDDVGSLVPVEDENALAKAIYGELTRSDKEKRKIRAHKYAFKTYSQEKIIGEMVEVYGSLIKGNLK